MNAIKATELMGFEIGDWRWSNPKTRKQAQGKPPEPIRVQLHHHRLANGYSPPSKGLEWISEALEKTARAALLRNGPEYPNLHASHWSGGYELKWENSDWRPYWAVSTWKIFTGDRADSELLATATVIPEVRIDYQGRR